MTRPAARQALALCLALVAPATARSDDLAADTRRLGDIVTALTGPPGDPALPEPELRVVLTATDGHWSADGQLLQDDRLVLPADMVILLEVTASDLLYEMEFPELGVTFTGVPGRIEAVLLEDLEPGIYFGDCRVTCGSRGAPLVLDIRPRE